MKAVLCRQFGEPLSFEEVTPPPLEAGQVRIKVAACGINFPDTLIVQGKYQFKPELPFSPGCEVAGEIMDIAPDVSGFAVGDPVIAAGLWGGFAEQMVAKARQVMHRPASMDAVTAAAFATTYGTSYHALKQRAALQPGETLLVLGAAGGVGLAAVELGREMGGTVIAAASSEEKLALARQYGAVETIDYSQGSLKDQIKALTGGRGADVIYDPVGGDLGEEAVR
ncbi:MAG TPA: NADPH:quinone oxidoreductase family protein, partial [Afifellaceae bacterium]|nr:NADPH:quinone oxidoreductase family protein [Afifellaceae bacterium]